MSRDVHECPPVCQAERVYDMTGYGTGVLLDSLQHVCIRYMVRGLKFVHFDFGL